MALPEKRPNLYVATILAGAVTATVSGGELEVGTLGTILSPIAIGAIQAIGTIGSIQAGQVTATVSGGGLAFVGTVVGTLVPLESVGTIGTIQAGAVTASVSGGVIQYIGTIGTILQTAGASVATIAFAGTIGTLISGQVTVLQNYSQTNVLTNAGVIAAGASTILAGTLQDLVVDATYGTVVAGSIRTSIRGVDPQTALLTSTITGGDWYAGTVVTGQRLIGIGPLGVKVAVIWEVGASSSIQGVYLTAQQSFSG